MVNLKSFCFCFWLTIVFCQLPYSYKYNLEKMGESAKVRHDIHN
jgi:hypothetical protein